MPLNLPSGMPKTGKTIWFTLSHIRVEILLSLWHKRHLPLPPQPDPRPTVPQDIGSPILARGTTQAASTTTTPPAMSAALVKVLPVTSAEDKMSQARQNLVEAWRAFSPKRPYILQGDESILVGSKKTGPIFSAHDSFEDYTGGDDYWDLASTKLHLGLLPVPYSGDLEKAKIFILMINPGLGDLDYVAEGRIPDYREALDQTRSQDQRILESQFPMMFLNPQFSWTGGGKYWIQRLRTFITQQKEAQKCSMADALSHLSRRICCIEYLPYHSAKFNLSKKLQISLKSTQLITEFVHNDIIPRAQQGDVGIIVRGKQYWQIPEGENVVILKGPHARRPHLGSKQRQESSSPVSYEAH